MADAKEPRPTEKGSASTPPDNTPGHHPPVEQDKPTSPPRVATTAREHTAHDLPPGGRLRFLFAFSLVMAGRGLRRRPAEGLIAAIRARTEVED
jgi:hypothetical protein